MRIVDIRECAVPIASEISNAWINFNKMNVSLVALRTDVIRGGRPVVGYGFNSNGRYAQGALLRERFIPRILKADPGSLLSDEGENLDPFKIWKVMMTDEKPGGHGERSVAVGVIDMAVWDAVAKIEGKPLHRLLAERYRGGVSDDTVSVYAAGGYYYPGKGPEALVEEMRGYLSLGYRDVKMKIGGVPLEEDIRRIEAVLGLLGDGGRLAVDANGRYSLDEAVRTGRAIEKYGLKWFEEPGDPLDYALQAELGSRYSPPMATGENLFSHQDARNLVRYAGMRPDRDILQMDPVLSYGLVEYLRTLEEIERAGWSRRSCIPHGGHQFALSIAAGLGLGGNESYPGVFAPFGGFADSTPLKDGRIGLPDCTGIGFEDKASIMDVIRREF